MKNSEALCLILLAVSDMTKQLVSNKLYSKISSYPDRIMVYEFCIGQKSYVESLDPWM